MTGRGSATWRSAWRRRLSNRRPELVDEAPRECRVTPAWSAPQYSRQIESTPARVSALRLQLLQRALEVREIPSAEHLDASVVVPVEPGHGSRAPRVHRVLRPAEPPPHPP